MNIDDDLLLSYIHVVCMAICMIASGFAILTAMLGLPILAVMFVWAMFSKYPVVSGITSFTALVLGLLYRALKSEIKND